MASTSKKREEEDLSLSAIRINPKQGESSPTKKQGEASSSAQNPEESAVAFVSKAPVLDFPNRLTRDYLCEKEPLFRALENEREKGWNSEKSEQYYQRLRKFTDDPSEATRWYFFDLNKKLGEDLHESTGAFTVGRPGGAGAKALNLCLAPGGYTYYFLKTFPKAVVSGITLPEADGGHPMMLAHNNQDPKIQVKFMDITMLAEEYGTPTDKIPASHPEAHKFTSERPFLGEVFDLVICDGQALRGHIHDRDRALEASRLLFSQLIFALARIKRWGTLVILLHKVDGWDTLLLLKAFEGFSRIRLYKPKVAHAQRSSFYLIAKRVDPESDLAVAAVQQWKEAWWRATFAGEGGTGLGPEEPEEAFVKSVLEQYGERWRMLSMPLWTIQLNAIVNDKRMQG